MTPAVLSCKNLVDQVGLREPSMSRKEQFVIRSLTRTIALSAILILALTVSGARAAGPPTEVVKEVIEKALDILNNPSLQGPGQKKTRRQQVKRIVDRHFDYREMAKRSLGAHLEQSQQFPAGRVCPALRRTPGGFLLR